MVILHKFFLVYTARIGHFDEAPGPAPSNFSLRDTPTRTIYVSVHFLVLVATSHINRSFNFHIFKSFVFFFKSGVVSEEAIDGFGRGGDIARLGHEAILGAEIVILFLRADGLTSHMPYTIYRQTIGEHIAVLGLGYIPLGAIKTHHIKEGIIGKESLGVPLII